MQSLLNLGLATPSSSILIVVGRQDTGELEAQIRGSRHAWDVRLISAEALIKLVHLKENAEGFETGLKIRSLFMPVEYTRLDRMVDVMFTTVRDVEEPDVILAPLEQESSSLASEVAQSVERTKWQFTDRELLQIKRQSIISALGKREVTSLVRQSRVLYWDASHSMRAACAISKRYTGKNQAPYWYAYHPQWNEFIEEADRGYFVLGCMDLNVAFAIPHRELAALLPILNTTTSDDRSYWHVHLSGNGSDLSLVLPRSDRNFDLRPFELSLE